MEAIFGLTLEEALESYYNDYISFDELESLTNEDRARTARSVKTIIHREQAAESKEKIREFVDKNLDLSI